MGILCHHCYLIRWELLNGHLDDRSKPILFSMARLWVKNMTTCLPIFFIYALLHYFHVHMFISGTNTMVVVLQLKQIFSKAHYWLVLCPSNIQSEGEGPAKEVVSASSKTYSAPSCNA